MKSTPLLYAVVFFLGIIAPGVYASDEIISYEHITDKTEFIFYQYDGTSLTREGDATHFTQTTGWLTGDTDGDGVDELISKEHIGGRTEFNFYSHDGTAFERDGDAIHATQKSGWLVADTDGDGVDEILTYDNITDKTEFVFYNHDGTSFIREGAATHYTQTTGWLACDTDGDGIAEIISYDHKLGKTEFIFYSHDGSSFTRESDYTHFTQITGWLTGDTDGDGRDEIISYEHTGDRIEFIFYSHDGSSFTRESDYTHTTQKTGWLVADTDEALSILSYSPTNTTLQATGGENITFSIEAEQSDGASSSYRFELNGTEVATTSEWTYAIDSEAQGRHTVTGLATDGKLTVRKEWSVDIEEVETPALPIEEQERNEGVVENSPPEIELYSPSDGEKIEGTVNIAWKVTDTIGSSISVILGISSDGGGSWGELATSRDDGSFMWNTETVNDGDYIIKITAENSAGVSEKSVELQVDNPDYGTIYISSKPSGASIIVGGEEFGITNTEVKVPVGYHTIEIKKEGHVPWAEWVEVTSGQNPGISERLIPTIFGFSPAKIGLIALAAVFSLVILFLLVKIKNK